LKIPFFIGKRFPQFRCWATKFLKFSNKDWIWTLKKFLVMDQEFKNQYPLTFATVAATRQHYLPVMIG